MAIYDFLPRVRSRRTGEYDVQETARFLSHWQLNATEALWLRNPRQFVAESIAKFAQTP